MYEEDELEEEGLVGDERPAGDGTLGAFYSRSGDGDHWASRLRRNPNRVPQPKLPSMVEGQDEQMWGQQRLIRFVTAGTGPTALVVNQLVQATRPARVWAVNVAFLLPETTDLASVKAPNATITATFIVRMGLGSTFIQRYVQLFDTDLVDFRPDPAFPLRSDTPTASTVLTTLPAKELLVSVNVKYDRILLAAPASLAVQVNAAVAPVYR